MRTQWVWHVSALAYRWCDVAVSHRADDDLFAFLGGRLRGSRVADCGCGPGALSEKLARRGASSLVAIDGNASMVRQARARLAPLIACGVADVVHGFIDPAFFGGWRGTFNLIVFKRSLYATRPACVATLAAAAAAIQPPGMVVVLHPERSLRRYAFGDPPRPRRHSAFHLVNRCLSQLAARLGISGYRTYTRGELVDLLADAGPGLRVEAATTSQQAYNIAALVIDRPAGPLY